MDNKHHGEGLKTLLTNKRHQCGSFAHLSDHDVGKKSTVKERNPNNHCHTQNATAGTALSVATSHTWQRAETDLEPDTI